MNKRTLILLILLISLSLFVLIDGVSHQDAIRLYLEMHSYKYNKAMPYNIRAINYIDAGEYDKAILEAMKAIEIYPGYAKAYTNLGVAYNQKCLYDQAISVYKKALQVNPRLFEALNNLGTAFYNKGQLDKAIEMHQKAARIKPKDRRVHKNLALDYLDKGLFDMAEKEFDVVRSLEAEDTSVLRDNEWNKKIGVFQEKIKLEPYNARANYLLGKIYYQLGMYGLAMVNFQKSIQVSPRYKGNDYNIGIAYNNLGASCIQKGKFDKAISNYKKAIRINPVLYPSHYGLGIAYWRKGNYEEAIRSCRYILKNKPDYLLAQYIIGVCYEQKRDYSEAIEEYKEVLKKVSSSKTFSILQCVSLNLARCYINMGMKDKASEQLNNFQIGFSYLDERHNPNGLLQFFSFADSFTIDGKEYHGKEEIKRALKDKFIEFVTTEEIKNKDDLYQKAQKLFDSGNIYLVFDLNDEALELLQKSKKFGGDSKTIFSIGIAYLQKGLLEKAVDEFYKAIRVDSSYRNYFDGIYNQLFFDEESFSSEVR